MKSNPVLEEVVRISKNAPLQVSPDTKLVGDEGVFDSLGLVELCLRLEDRASELGFEFDWTSDSAMSSKSGMFRSVQSLEEEFFRQKQLNQ